MNPKNFQIRVVQFLMVLSALSLIPFSRTVPHATHRVSASFQWSIALVAIAGVLLGFIVQRVMQRARKPHARTLNSTPLNRWMMGHISRLATAYSVTLFAFVLLVSGSSSTLVGVLYIGGLLLLLIWRPGVAPTQTESQSSAG